jgi:hypothetical protein
LGKAAEKPGQNRIKKPRKKDRPKRNGPPFREERRPIGLAGTSQRGEIVKAGSPGCIGELGELYGSTSINQVKYPRYAPKMEINTTEY